MPEFHEFKGQKNPNTHWDNEDTLNRPFKSVDNYENKSVRPCYIPENAEEDFEGYSFFDFVKIAVDLLQEYSVGANLEMTARNIFDLCEWQDPHTIIDETDWKEEFEESPESWGIDKSEELADWKNLVQQSISNLEELMELLPKKGDNTADCQRTQLESRLQDFQYSVNGVKENDFIYVEE